MAKIGPDLARDQFKLRNPTTAETNVHGENERI